jgi:hypothetical protein
MSELEKWPDDGKELDLFKLKTFEANGNKYYVCKTISIPRYKEYLKLEPRLTYGIGFNEIFTQLKTAYSYLNTKDIKPLDAGIIIHNIMNGIKSIEGEEREHPALMMAALVINKDGEDVSVFNEQEMRNKINDWAKEGYNIISFFAFALNSIQGFRQNYAEYIIQGVQEMEKEISKKVETPFD